MQCIFLLRLFELDFDCVCHGPAVADDPEAARGVRRGRGRGHVPAAGSAALLRWATRRLLRHQGEIHQAHARTDGGSHQVIKKRSLLLTN